MEILHFLLQKLTFFASRQLVTLEDDISSMSIYAKYKMLKDLVSKIQRILENRKVHARNLIDLNRLGAIWNFKYLLPFSPF